jgi:hypothetical protein
MEAIDIVTTFWNLCHCGLALCDDVPERFLADCISRKAKGKANHRYRICRIGCVIAHLDQMGELFVALLRTTSEHLYNALP